MDFGSRKDGDPINMMMERQNRMLNKLSNTIDGGRG